MRNLTTRQALKKMRSYTVSQGYGAGEPLRILPWEKDLVRGILNSRLSAMTIARGGGKSTIVGAIAAAFYEHMIETGQRADVVCVASSFQQGKIVFDHARSFLGEQVQNRKAFKIQGHEHGFKHRTQTGWVSSPLHWI